MTLGLDNTYSPVEKDEATADGRGEMSISKPGAPLLQMNIIQSHMHLRHRGSRGTHLLLWVLEAWVLALSFQCCCLASYMS